MDEIKQEKLKKLPDEILSGTKQVGVDVNRNDYTEEELNFIKKEIDRRISGDLDELMQILETGN